MLTLRTGTPGAGKTLTAVAELAKLHRHWSTPAGASKRRIVYANVNGLTLPHWPIPEGEPIKDKFGEVACRTVDWDKIEPGSLVIFDEAQTHFPPLPVGSTVPPHIAFLNVHRHKGLDIEFITQHPKNLHANVRRLTGKHVHMRRVFGWSRAVQYEWDHCQDNLSNLKTAVMVQASYPRDVFALYKSAEVHTKQRFRFPMWAAVPFLVIPLAVWAVPSAYSTLSGAMTGKGLAPALATTPKPSPSASPPVAATTSAVAAPGAVGPEVAQAGVGFLASAASSKPVPVGCIAAADRCVCFGQDGSRLDLAPDLCRSEAQELHRLNLGRGYGASPHVEPVTRSVPVDVGTPSPARPEPV